MTNAEWKESRQVPMNWSIYANPMRHDEKQSFEDWELDLSAGDVPDGEYVLAVPSYDPPGTMGNLNRFEGWGVTVKDGQFVPKPTARAIYEAVLRQTLKEDESLAEQYGKPVHHCYVEEMKWDGIRFIARIGS